MEMILSEARTLQNIRLSETQKKVLTRIISATSPKAAADEISTGRNMVTARDVLNKLELIDYRDGHVVVTDKGKKLMLDSNLIDNVEDPTLTDEGNKFAYDEDEQNTSPAVESFSLLKEINILSEAARAPLYHFTPLSRFYDIIRTNTLKGGVNSSERDSSHERSEKDASGESRISLTRDVRRTSMPKAIGKSGIGIQLDASKLKAAYGKKRLTPYAKGTMDVKSFLKKYPKMKEEINGYIEKHKKGELSNATLRINGIDIFDMVRGEAALNQKWESEERLYVPEVKDIKKFITGVVIPSEEKVKEKSARAAAMALILLMDGKSGFDKRNDLFDAVNKLNVPIIWQGKGYTTADVKKEMIALFRLRKDDPKEFKELQLKLEPSSKNTGRGRFSSGARKMMD